MRLPLLLLAAFFFSFAVPGTKSFWSKVRVEKKLADPFFTKRQFKHSWYMIRHEDGSWESTMSDSAGKAIIDTTRYEITARCLVNKDTFNVLDEADAWFEKDTLRIRLKGMSASFFARFDIDVHKDNFTSAYSTSFIYPTELQRWETLRQQLILDKKSYKPGDEVRGRVRYECLQTVHAREFGTADEQPINIYTDTVWVEGVFRCRVKK